MPELRRGDPEQRALLREPQIAGGRQLAAAAHAVPADRRQGRLGEGGERLLGPHRERPAASSGGLPQRGDVGPGAEGAALAGQHQRPYARGRRPAGPAAAAAPATSPAVMALRLAGWWMTTVATPSVTLCSSCGSMAPDAIRPPRPYDQEGAARRRHRMAEDARETHDDRARPRTRPGDGTRGGNGSAGASAGWPCSVCSWCSPGLVGLGLHGRSRP